MEKAGGYEHRRELLSGLSGRVLELGAGAGSNFRHYPPDVEAVVAIEPEPSLRASASRAAARVPLQVEVLGSLAEALPVADACFDAVVCSLVLCSVSNPDGVLREAKRALRPGGELRVYEHLRSEDPRFARVQRAVDLLWPHVAAGCHTSRDTIGSIERAGFSLVECRRFTFRPSVLAAPVSPHVIARARAAI